MSEPRFRYRRYDVKIYSDPNPRDGISDDALHREALGGVADRERVLKRIARMDDPSTLQQLLKLGLLAGESKVGKDDFPALFDLPAAATPSPSSAAAATSTGRRPYQRQPGLPVQAIQLTLLTEGFHYDKWGGRQTCIAGDWIVNNHGDVYSIDAETFALTYRPVGGGLYEKHTTIWAEPAAADGVVTTKEGEATTAPVMSSCSTSPTARTPTRSPARNSSSSMSHWRTTGTTRRP
ncbi:MULTISPECIES: hypothetical protein [unclassified Synechococcus]|uniref:hypothetical protein n=1 Tax=unclassified Synechococcus TaxID=2626047 RepID=UPI000069965B|nr:MULTISPECIES: hypothetical protein [unclassified Synechococcus]EAQ75257.1 hypothetical protein WH5701_09244 [Synechococcus sp. WH 5701]WFN57847.1 hypothetical protein N4320_08240 [Synechococcus sp. CCFWC 502]